MKRYLPCVISFAFGVAISYYLVNHKPKYCINVPASGADYAIINHPGVDDNFKWKITKFRICRAITSQGYYETSDVSDETIQQYGWIVAIDGNEYTLIPLKD